MRKYIIYQNCSIFLGGPQMHHSSVQGVSDPASTVAAVGGHPGAHGAHEASFFASSDAASRYYQMHYESAAASQGNIFSG